MITNMKRKPQAFQFPRSIPQTNLRMLRTVSRPYEAFATAYATGNPEILHREVNNVHQDFLQDGNWGLAELCLENFRRLRIQALTHTYSTLSVETIAAREYSALPGSGVEKNVGAKDIEEYILDMVTFLLSTLPLCYY